MSTDLPNPQGCSRQHDAGAGDVVRRRLAPAALARRKARRQCTGAALPIVLVISSMMLATCAAWLEASTANVRRVANMDDYLKAFHAADGALTLCTRALRAGVAPALPAVEREPEGWKQAGIFDGPLSFTPHAPWPGAARAPQCLIEAWRLANRPQAQAYLLTARGFGARQATQAWLQLEVVLDDGKVREAHWRRLVARPL